MSRLVVAIAILCALSGCSQQSRYRPARTDAEKMLFFYEQDRRGENHGLSADQWDSGETTRVPDPAFVDLDSVLQIQVRSPASRGGSLLEASGEDLLGRKAFLRELLNALEATILARKRAVSTYAAGGGERFKAARREYGTVRGEFLGALTDLFPRDPDDPSKPDRSNPEYREFAEAFNADPTLAPVRDLLEKRIAVIEKEDRAAIREAESRAATLRLQAFLEGAGADLTPIHLRGYDTLPQGELQTRDRLGLDLTDAELDRLEKNTEATRELANTLEDVRREERSLRESLAAVLPVVSRDLATELATLDALIDKLTAAERMEELRSAFDKVVVVARADLGALEGSVEERLEALPADLLANVRQNAAPVVQAAELLQEIQQLGDRAGAVRSPELALGIVGDADRLVRRARDLVTDSDWTGELKKTSQAMLRARAGELGAAVSSSVESTFAGGEARELKLQVERYYADVKTARRSVMSLLGTLGFTVQPIAATPDVLEVLDVPFDQLEDTSLDLTRVAGQPGDRVLIKASVREGGRERSAEATFDLTRFGWYAELVPSVVLVRADDLSSGSESFQFAPVIAWMHHYRPRPEADGFLAGAARGLRPAVGLHTAFLPYDPDNDVAIGIGGTLSFWDDRLQFGGGYNLMSDGGGDGEVYYFVGSDLIGLLQTVGIGN